MIRLSKHIAFLLFGVFIFPILFQSVHIVRHHSHDIKCEHEHCHQTIADKGFHSNVEINSEKEKSCLICEFEFSINDLPEIAFFSPAINVIDFNYAEIATQEARIQVLSEKSPRAPPVLIS